MRWNTEKNIYKLNWKLIRIRTELGTDIFRRRRGDKHQRFPSKLQKRDTEDTHPHWLRRSRRRILGKLSIFRNCQMLIKCGQASSFVDKTPNKSFNFFKFSLIFLWAVTRNRTRRFDIAYFSSVFLNRNNLEFFLKSNDNLIRPTPDSHVLQFFTQNFSRQHFHFVRESQNASGVILCLRFIQSRGETFSFAARNYDSHVFVFSQDLLQDSTGRVSQPVLLFRWLFSWRCRSLQQIVYNLFILSKITVNSLQSWE